MSESGTKELSIESQEVEPAVLDQLVPRLPAVWCRVSVGLVLILVATVAGRGIGNGYVVADPFSSEFEVREVVVSSFGNTNDGYVQFAVANQGHRDIELQRVYQDRDFGVEAGAFAELPEPRSDRSVPWGDQPFGYADGGPSILNSVVGQRDRAMSSAETVTEGQLSFAADLTRDLVELPVVVPAGKSIIVALIFSAGSCADPQDPLGSLAAEVRFTSYQWLSPTRTERFEFSDEVNILAIGERGEMFYTSSIPEAICEVAG